MGKFNFFNMLVIRKEMPVINKSESERMQTRVNRILYADFLAKQNDFTNGLAPFPPVLKSRYELFNQLAAGRLETTVEEQTARTVVAISSPPVISLASITPSATNTSVTLSLPVSTAVTSYTYVVLDASGIPLVQQPTITGNAATTGQVTFSGLTIGTKYSVVVTSTGPSGTSVSAPLPIYTLPTSPSGFSATAPTTGGSTIRWSGGSGATSYEYIVRDSTNNIVTGVSIVDNGTSGAATFTGLNPGSRYSITVIPKNSSGSPSSPPSVFSINTAPASPPAPRSTGSTTDGFSIPLTTSVGATATIPYIYTVDGTAVTTTSSPVSYAVIGNDVVFSGLTPGPHDVRVTSVSATGVQSPGTLATLYTKPVAPLANTFSVVSTSPSVLTVRWSGNTGATSYSYVIKGNGVQIANPTFTDNGASGNVVFSNLTPGVAYSVEVIVTNPANSVKSSAVTAYTAPNAATSITQTAGTITSATIAWTDAAGATSYSYSVKDVTDASQNSVGSVSTASSLKAATITGLAAGKTYYVIITSINANGSTESSRETVYTTPSKPTGLYQVSSTPTSITMAWYNGVGATSYVYTLGTATMVPSVNNGVTSQSAVFSGLTAGQTYTPITVTAQRVVNSSLTLSFASDTFTTAGTSPSAPTFPASPITTLSSTGFTVNWVAGSGAGAYSYTLSLSAGGSNILGAAPGPRVASSTANSVTFEGLTAGTQYYPEITATISGIPGTSSSNPSPVTTVAGPAAATITNTPSSTITSKGVTIGFTPVAGITYSYTLGTTPLAAITSLTPPATTPSYYLTTLGQPVSSTNPLVPGQAATVQFTGLSSGAAQTVSINSTDSGGITTPYSYPFTTAAAPSAPTATAAATQTQTSISLTLPAPSAGITYSYVVSGGNPSAVLSPQPVPTISGNTYTFGGLTGGTAYTVAVTSRDAAGATSTYTSPSITTSSPAPVVPTKATTPITSTTSKGFTVNWNTVSGATSYNYSINTGGTSAQGANQTTTSTTAAFTGLTAGTSYTVRVYSVGTGGQSSTYVEYIQSTLAGPTAIVFGTVTSTSTTISAPFTGGTSPVAGNTITYTATATPSSGTAVNSISVTSTLASFSGLTAGTQYTIRVTATDTGATTSTNTISHTTPTNAIVSIDCPVTIPTVRPHILMHGHDNNMYVFIATPSLKLVRFTSSGYGTNSVFTPESTTYITFYNPVKGKYISISYYIHEVSTNFQTQTLLKTGSNVVGTDYKEKIYIKTTTTTAYPKIFIYNTTTNTITEATITNTRFDAFNNFFNITENSTQLFVFTRTASSTIYISVYNKTTYALEWSEELKYNGSPITTPPNSRSMIVDNSGNLIFVAKSPNIAEKSLIFILKKDTRSLILFAGSAGTLSETFTPGTSLLTTKFHDIINMTLNTTSSILYAIQQITNSVGSTYIVVSMPYTPPP